MTAPTLRLTPSSIVRTVVIVGVAVVVAGVTVRAVHPLMWFLQASVVAALSWPVIQRLARVMPAWLAVLALTAAVAVVVGAIGTAGFTELQNEAERFSNAVPAAARRLEDAEPFGGVLKDLRLADQVEQLAADFSDRFQLTGTRLPGLASQVGGGVSATFVVWVLAVMLVFTGPGMVDSAVGTLAEPRRGRTREVLRAAYAAALRYLGLTAVRSVVMGVVTYVLADALSIDMPALLAVAAALMAFLPYVGIVLGAVPVALLAVVRSPTESMVILGAAAAVQVVDALVVQPRIHRASFGFGLFPTLVVVALGVSLYGVIGLFVGLSIGALAMAVVQTLGTPDVAADGPDGGEGGPGVAPGPAPAGSAAVADA